MTVHHGLRLLIGAGFLAFASAPVWCPESYAFDAESGQSFADIASHVRNAVVTVAAAVVDRQALLANHRHKTTKDESSEAFGGNQDSDDFSPSRPKQRPGEPPRQFTSIGSGFVIDPSGLIVTNNHVIEGGNTIYVILADGTELKVDKILGRDTKSDLTLLKVTPNASKPLSAVSFGDSSRARIGDWVIAIGNPFGLKGTVTAGILSGRGRDINAGPYDDFLQTDAAINRGNSGGPLFNSAGEVIGINTAIFSPSGGSIGLGFAIPSNDARRVVDQLEHYGETRWGWIGVRLQTPTEDLVPTLHLPSAEGALIARVDKGGPADMAGIAEGDVILSFAGTEVRHARQLPRYIAEAPIGEEVDAVIMRGAEQKTIKIRVGRLEEASSIVERPNTHPSRPRRHKLGKMKFELPSAKSSERFVLPQDEEGALVAETPVSRDGLKPGDIIVEAAQQRIRTPDELAVRLKSLRELGREEALLTVKSPDGEIRFASVPLSDL